jgi:hypothetical protein
MHFPSLPLLLFTLLSTIPLTLSQRAGCQTQTCDTSGTVTEGTNVRLEAPDWYETTALFTWRQVNPVGGVALTISSGIPTPLRVTVSRPLLHYQGFSQEYTVGTNGGETMILTGHRWRDWNGQTATISVNFDVGPSGEREKEGKKGEEEEEEEEVVVVVVVERMFVSRIMGREAVPQGRGCSQSRCIDTLDWNCHG